MTGSESLFEIHLTYRDAAGKASELPAPVPEAVESTSPCVLTVAESDVVWIGSPGQGGPLERVSGPDRAALGVRVVRHRLSTYLAVLPVGRQVLVNGLPASGLAVLSSGDSLVAVAGGLCHVTERVLPHVGPPTDELLGKKCPFCSLAVTADTRVVVCRCGVPYHHETVESHPGTAEEDRLSCFSRARVCLSCGREVSTEEYRIWDPRSL